MRHRVQKREDKEQRSERRRAGVVVTVPNLGKSGEQVGDRSVVAESLADMHVSIYIAWTEDETTPELKRILSKAVLSVSCFFRPLAGNRVVLAKDV